MKKNVSRYVVLLGLMFIVSCQEERSECTHAKQIGVEAGCYDPAFGLTLVAQNVNPDYNNLTWEILVSDSTVRTPDDIRIVEPGHETVTVPDSVLLDHIHVIARVRTDCGGWYLYSKYFSFMRVDEANCTVWEGKEK